jgi:hypothetical protein
MLLVLEKFFDTKVAAPPYRQNYLTTFTRILLCPIDPLKDIVSIIRFQLSAVEILGATLEDACLKIRGNVFS